MKWHVNVPPYFRITRIRTNIYFARYMYAYTNIFSFCSVEKHRPFLKSIVDETNNYINAVCVDVSMSIRFSIEMETF